ncbi:MAG TPA: HD-GYP domain-containing protein, partial [Spirochaetota bacterium]|nr:HD-GYP domain-containing protein [Spirochaetota bacterium]
GRAADIEYQYDKVNSQTLSFSGGIFVFRDVTERAKNEAKIQNTLMMLRKAMGGIIQAMAVTVETRDPYTAGHQKRVTELARKIADYMNLKDDIKDGLRMAGIIHDIGKISVPAEILSKPGKLSDIEFSLIKNHPQSGYEILKNIEFPWPVAMIVRQHHERLDGSGYPDGIKSDEILIESKILAVADVVEAMASHRPYRASLGIHAAIDEIIKNKGKYYDPDVVNACVAVFAKGDFSFD